MRVTRSWPLTNLRLVLSGHHTHKHADTYVKTFKLLSEVSRDQTAKQKRRTKRWIDMEKRRRSILKRAGRHLGWRGWKWGWKPVRQNSALFGPRARRSVDPD